MAAPDRVRALAERLVAAPSASPDLEAETRCAGVLAELLPATVQRRVWAAADGRPIVVARAGAARRVVLLLGHYDTVGAGEFAALGEAGAAHDPRAALALARRRASEGAAEPRLLADLEEEERAPGTWCFGRGMLDMKSGLAAGIAALEALANDPEPGGGALLVATPDEEHESAGMRRAVEELVRLAEDEGLGYLGALDLDYGLEPAAFLGVDGKVQLGAYVVGAAGHVADASRRADAVRLAAALVAALGRPGDGFEPPPVVLRLDDLRSGYTIEPAIEAMVEASVPWDGRPLERLLATLRARAEEAIAAVAGASPRPRVATLPELAGRAAAAPAAGAAAGAAAQRFSAPAASVAAAAPGEAARAATLERVRAACRASRVAAPAVVLHLLPPLYPPAAAGSGPLVGAAIERARAEGLALPGRYPFISDACYAAWRAESLEALRPHFPALGAGYDLPEEAARALDLDVVHLGPWGRDAHGLHERVHAPYAFGRLPGLIERVVRDTLRA